MSVDLEDTEEPTNPYSEGFMERYLQLPSGLPEEPSEEPTIRHSEGFMERYLQPPSGLSKEPSEEPTIRHSEGFMERYLQPPSGLLKNPNEERRLHLPSVPHSPGDIHNKIASQASSQDQFSVPITEIETPNPKCRLLIQPGDPAAFRSGEGGRRQYLRRQSASPPHLDTTIECIAITQGPERANYCIYKPVCCRLVYDTEGDSITIQNCQLYGPIMIAEVTKDGTSKSNVVKPLDDLILRPGAWVVRQHASNGLPAFQLMIYPRTYSLSVINIANPGTISGTKRMYPSDELDEDDENHTKVSAPMNLSLSGIINNLGDVKAGELVVVATDRKEEYRIRRLKKHTDHNTLISSVYLASVSLYPELSVVVKFIKGDSAISRSKAWQREYDLHKQLDCDAIVPVVGADARFSVIYLKYIDAKDLAHQRRHDRKGYFFLGDEQDAVRILRDMARALSYLSERSIVHHDIKPANILYCTKTGCAFLIDFGLGCKESSQRHYGGSPWYVGPEYLNTKGQRLRSEDVWALGIVMLYLLRRLPLPDVPGAGWLIKHASDPSSVANKKMREWIGVVQTLAKEELDESNQLHSLVKKMLVLNPETRIKPEEITKELQVQRPDIYQTRIAAK